MTFLAAKKTPEIWAFIVVMFGFILWTGGSILMRLQVFPGVVFWYYVSIMALFSLALLIYFFVCSFARVKGYFLKILWSVGTLALLVVTACGRILAPPTVDVTAEGVFFRYSMTWTVVIPCIFFFLIVLSIAKIFLDVIREKGIRTPGIMSILLGCAVVGVGNMVQVIPGNVFPWDTLSGIFFALFIIWALYKKRMFRMTLLVSRTLLTIVCAGVFVLVCTTLVEPVNQVLRESYHLSAQAASSTIVIVFAVMLSLICFLTRKLIDTLFTREEQRSRLLRDFSSSVSRDLNSGEVMGKLAAIIQSEIAVTRIFICLPDRGGYAIRYASEPLSETAFAIPADSPCVRALQSGEGSLQMAEFRSDPLYLSVWNTEKQFLRDNSVVCISALRDGEEIVGLLLLSGKDRNAKLSYNELNFLDMVLSIASIAVKNAGLYEQMYREARIDSLTEVYNYRYFVEKLNLDFKACQDDSLALVYVDLDDFKLYNQLYGASEGDRALCAVAKTLTLCTGEGGTVFRNSGKVFAILLPHYDGRRAGILAEELKKRIAAINDAPERCHLKKLSASFGICVSPYAAATAKELMENADLAVYNAKSSGKNGVYFFKGAEPVSQRIATRAMTIVENSHEHNNAYQSNSATIYALTAAIDAKDHYTYKHSHNVAVYAATLATAAGLNDDQIAIVYEAALLHDIGKISIPESILGKSSKLSGEEYSIMKGHVNSAIEMIRYLPAMDYVIPCAVGHHERWDGLGYPRGLAGDNIPVSARCLALADAFDAMTTDRPYRKGLTAAYAAEQIEKNAGTQFDPALAAVFVSLIRSGEISLKPVDQAAL